MTVTNTNGINTTNPPLLDIATPSLSYPPHILVILRVVISSPSSPYPRHPSNTALHLSRHHSNVHVIQPSDDFVHDPPKVSLRTQSPSGPRRAEICYKYPPSSTPLQSFSVPRLVLRDPALSWATANNKTHPPDPALTVHDSHSSACLVSTSKASSTLSRYIPSPSLYPVQEPRCPEPSRSRTAYPSQHFHPTHHRRPKSDVRHALWRKGRSVWRARIRRWRCG